MKTSDIAQQIADDCIGVRVRMLNRVVTRMYDDLLRPHGVRFSQMNILTVVSLQQPIQPSEVGKILAIEKSTLSRNLRLMEQNGWIASSPAANGNGQLFTLTAEGRSLYRKAARAWQQAQSRLSDLWGKSTMKTIRQAADDVCLEQHEH